MKTNIWLFSLLAVSMAGGSFAVAEEETTFEVNVVNLGVPSQNSTGGRGDFRREVLSSGADWVLLYYGLNDTLNERQFVDLPKFIFNLNRIVDLAREDGITPVLCTIHDSNEEALLQRHELEVYGDERPNEKIDRYNQAIREFASEKGVRLADFAKVSQESDGKIEWLHRDGVHLTAEGNQLLANTFYEVIQPDLENGQIVMCLGDSVTFGSTVSGKGTAEGETYPAFLKQLAERK
ncbi:SGNH/GDSL hydrolase family protein [Puniceicoccus vermicola]|uniref:SGNH hydrolase-type esterase domain-containing protein n=1 Tax=Puniceicoccus vermicola TaxID=388746 RepID=A0A7X1E5A5_9BACT|nr:GDSL-type esterase/lipase family protein [Puniceicoccus vermicola]MBC2602929.1 hypothetical protein [Puniceicoccus vermicola]